MAASMETVDPLRSYRDRPKGLTWVEPRECDSRPEGREFFIYLEEIMAENKQEHYADSDLYRIAILRRTSWRRRCWRCPDGKVAIAADRGRVYYDFDLRAL